MVYLLSLKPQQAAWYQQRDVVIQKQLPKILQNSSRTLFLKKLASVLFALDIHLVL